MDNPDLDRTHCVLLPSHIRRLAYSNLALHQHTAVDRPSSTDLAESAGQRPLLPPQLAQPGPFELGVAQFFDRPDRLADGAI